MAAFGLTLALGALFLAVGMGVFLACSKRIGLAEVLLSPALGVATLVIVCLSLGKCGLPVQTFALPVFILCVIACAVAARRFPWKSTAGVFSLLFLASLVTGWPMLRYGFDWVSIVNQDMTNYVLMATYHLHHGYLMPPNGLDLSHSRDVSNAYWFLTIIGQERVGADYLLSFLMATTGLLGTRAFMPLIVAFGACVVAAGTGAALVTTRSRLVALTAALLLICSALGGFGVMFQLLGQEAGLSLLFLGLALAHELLSDPAEHRWGNAMLFGISVGAVGLTYPEFLPLLILALGAKMFASHWPGIAGIVRSIPAAWKGLLERPPLCIALIAFFPLCLVMNPSWAFGGDWLPVESLLGYAGQYFASHLSFPTVVNDDGVIGLPNALFYGSLYWSIGALPAALLGGVLTCRITLYAAMLCVVAQTYVTTRRFGGSRRFGYLLAFLTACATYPLSDVYERGDYSEFLGICLITSGACAYLRFLLRDDRSRAGNDLVQAAAFVAVAVGVHPLVTLLGGSFFAYLGLAGAFISVPRALRGGVVIAAVAAMVTGPWLYLVTHFHPAVQGAYGGGIGLLDDDKPFVRLFPFPWDVRGPFFAPAKGVPVHVSTPFLALQVNDAMLLVACALAIAVWRCRVRIGLRNVLFILVSELLGAIIFYASTSHAFAASAGPFSVIQFAYRFTAYIDAAILLSVLAMLRALTASGWSYTGKAWSRVVRISAVLGFAAVLLSLQHAWWYQTSPSLTGLGFGEDGDVLQHTNQTYWSDYVVTKGFGKIDTRNTMIKPTLRLPVGFDRVRLSDFGVTGEREVVLAKPTRLVTNVQAFPWNRLTLDGVLLDRGSIDVRSGVSYQTPLIPSGRHRIGYMFQPDLEWIGLRYLSFAMLSILFVVIMVYAWRTYGSMLSARISLKIRLGMGGIAMLTCLLIWNVQIPQIIVLLTERLGFASTEVYGRSYQALYRLPDAAATFFGLRALAHHDGIGTQLVIVLGFLLLFVCAALSIARARRGDLVSMLACVMVVLTVSLYAHHVSFAIFKMAMYAQPVCLVVLASAVLVSRWRIPSFAALMVFAIVNLATAFYYTRQSIASSLRDAAYLQIRGASSLRIRHWLEERDMHGQVIVDSENPSLEKLASIYASDAQMFYPSMDVFLPIIGRPGLRDFRNPLVRREMERGELLREAYAARSHRVQFPVNGKQAVFLADSLVGNAEHGDSTVLISGNPITCLNREGEGAAREPLSIRPLNEVHDLLIFKMSSLGAAGDSDVEDKTLFQYEADIFDPNATIAAIGRYLVFNVLHPSEELRLIMDVSDTLRPDRVELPRPVVSGSSPSKPLPVYGRGSARIISPPIRPRIIDGQAFVAIDMNREPSMNPEVPRTGLMRLFGNDIPLDPRKFVLYTRGISAVSEEAYQKLKPPTTVIRFPSDLINNRALAYSGIYEDGWASEDFSVRLSTVPGRAFVVKGMIPQVTDPAYTTEATVFVDGIAMLKTQLGTGDFTLSVPAPQRPSATVRVRFSRYQRLPNGDDRPVSALIYRIGAEAIETAHS